jgi:hypothetical protein
MRKFADDRHQEAGQEEKSDEMPLIMVQAKNEESSTEATEDVQVGEWTEVKLQPASHLRMFHRLNEASFEDLKTTLAKEYPTLSIGNPTGLNDGWVLRSHKLKGGMLRAQLTPNKKRRQMQPPGQKRKKQRTKSRTKKVPAEAFPIPRWCPPQAPLRKEPRKHRYSTRLKTRRRSATRRGWTPLQL